MKVKIKKLHEDAVIPTYGTDGAGAFDISTTESGVVYRGNPKVFKTGLAFEIPEGHVMLLFSRSGHGFRSNTRLANCVGVIDSDYRGELMVKLTMDGGGMLLDVKRGDRIAQGIIIPSPRIEFDLSEDLTTTDRGDKGFGSTG